MFTRSFAATACFLLAAALAGCGGDDDGGPPGGDGARIWAPESLGIRQLWDLEVAPELTVDATLEEAGLAFDEVEPELRSAIEGESLDADLVIVPEAMGRRLLADGLLEEPYVVLFSSEDPDEAAEMFGVLMAPPAGRGAGAGGLTAPTGPTVEYEHGCLTPESREALRTALSPRRSVGSARLALDVPGVEEIEGTTEAAAEGLVEAVGMQIVMDGVVDTLKALAMRFGMPTALRLVSRANVVVSTLMTAKALLEYGDAVADVIEARSEAVVAATETYYDAVEAISGARTGLYDIRTRLRSCELSGEDARMELESLQSTVNRHERAARAALADIATLEGENADLKAEALDNGVSRFLELWPEIRDEADAKTASMPPDLTGVGETASELVDMPSSSDPDWRAFTELLTGLDPDNPFTHSNGELMSTADAEVDLRAVGAAWLEVSPASAMHLFSSTGRFPCGTGPVATTHCGTMPFPSGRALMIAAIFDEVLSDSAPGDYYQYGFPLDGDGDTSNNYEASPSYPKDLYDGTDWWLELLHDGASDTWSLGSTLARYGSTSPRATASRIIVNGNSAVAIVPSAELESTSPTFRATAFWHTGDYGIEAPHEFNGDIYPEVGMPLMMPDPTVFVGHEGP